MTRDEALTVRVGDTVIPDPVWNAETGSRHNKFPASVSVLNIITKRHSQTGIMFKVETIGKDPIWLDAGWFSLPEKPE